MFNQSSLSVALDLAAKGMRILWVERLATAQRIVRAVGDPRIAKVYRSNSRERIVMHSGGEIVFGSTAQGVGRGYMVDALFVHPLVYRDQDAMDNLLPTLNHLRTADKLTPGVGDVFVLFDRVG